MVNLLPVLEVYTNKLSGSILRRCRTDLFGWKSFDRRITSNSWGSTWWAS